MPWTDHNIYILMPRKDPRTPEELNCSSSRYMCCFISASVSAFFFILSPCTCQSFCWKKYRDHSFLKLKPLWGDVLSPYEQQQPSQTLSFLTGLKVPKIRMNHCSFFTDESTHVWVFGCEVTFVWEQCAFLMLSGFSTHCLYFLWTFAKPRYVSTKTYAFLFKLFETKPLPKPRPMCNLLTHERFWFRIKCKRTLEMN